MRRIAFGVLIMAASCLNGCERSDKTATLIDQTRRIELAKIDLQIKDAQIEAAHAKAILDRETTKPATVQQSLSPEGVNRQIELLQDAMVNYRRKSDRLESLIEARNKIDKK